MHVTLRSRPAQLSMRTNPSLRKHNSGICSSSVTPLGSSTRSRKSSTPLGGSGSAAAESHHTAPFHTQPRKGKAGRGGVQQLHSSATIEPVETILQYPV